ncbi:MAG: hypothetical protein CSA33_04760 [Desulfobulbus propionicus]|nr:MAG: hypothetical protein CSA33_04760 [Desulfobulbus propionicus]
MRVFSNKNVVISFQRFPGNTVRIADLFSATGEHRQILLHIIIPLREFVKSYHVRDVKPGFVTSSGAARCTVFGSA